MENETSNMLATLNTLNTSFENFNVLYTKLVDRGIQETEYGKTFETMANDLASIYASTRSKYDALQFNRKEFDSGSMDSARFQKLLIQLSGEIYSAEFEVRFKILPKLRKVEKDLLREQIVEKIEAINIPENIKKEVQQEAEEIQKSMATTDKIGSVSEQVREYVAIGEKVVRLGEKLWKLAKQAAPYVPIILQIFRP